MKLMKKIVAVALVVMSLLAIALPAMAETTKYVNVTPNVNFRSSPNGALIDRIPYQATVTEYSTSVVNGETWSYILYNGQYGYVMQQFLSQGTGSGSTSGHPTSMSQAFGSYTLKEGQTSYYVKNLQIALNKANCNAGSADGIFGENTFDAVVRFQHNNGLYMDGLVGSATKAKLWEVAGAELMQNGVMSL